MLDNLKAEMEAALSHYDGDPGPTLRILEVKQPAGNATDDTVTLTLGMFDGAEDTTVRFAVKAYGVRAAKLHAFGEGYPLVTQRHPLIEKHSAPHASLFVADMPQDARAFMGSLWQAHRERDQYTPLSRYMHRRFPFTEPGEDGMILIATGPEPTIEAYTKVARQYGLQPEIRRRSTREPIRWAKPRWAPHDVRLWLLELGRSWVVAKSFSAKRL